MEDVFVEEIYKKVIEVLEIKKRKNKKRLERGIKQLRKIWPEKKDNKKKLEQFCINNFVVRKKISKYIKRIQKNYETLYGHLNSMRREILEPIHIADLEPLKIDYMFSNINLSPVVEDLFYEKEVAYFAALNFDMFTLKEKNRKGKFWKRKDWIKTKIVDKFRYREPKKVKKKIGELLTQSEMYISNYNINTSILIDDRGHKVYPDNKKLISHWGLRDEVKSLYREKKGIKKQKTIYKVVERIVNQSIPKKVINNRDLRWDVYTNIFNSYEKFEKDTRRYELLLKLFKQNRKLDAYYDKTNNTAIKRNFNLNVKIERKKIIKEFEKILESDLTGKTAEIIKNDLGRDLEPFDIWYDGFKTDQTVNEAELDKITKEKYKSCSDFEDDLENIIGKMGFSEEMSKEIADKIIVDNAKGSGHAWGVPMKGEKAHLRTRFDEDGMNYKGYNIAIHELGHNVEQVLSQYYIEDYMLTGVPNTAFSEAFAFMFQKNDLRILGESEETNENILRKFWNLYEIIGVALTEIKIWEWMYENPDADTGRLKDAAVQISKDVWNEYYAENFNVVSSPILGIYSHMINHPLYLVNYPLGHLIESMIEDFIDGKSIGEEMMRMCKIGSITPKYWMKEAVGEHISSEPLLKKVKLFVDNNFGV
ncbi:MAG: hypothetical protein FXF47_05600 [Candidatus Mcinerneyibacterium aminivorans]|uniref:M3 family oligoendopeptidase n=1 Tax=Candidatus Mcinerneyibacterium aminivorans TaxID=2703815 RepID=A0A5D0MI18_9BACT|nr:MAG: hypothetical protein FXF47_05600 [Candidatus Mcinerneyibacterium aminivorans]